MFRNNKPQKISKECGSLNIKIPIVKQILFDDKFYTDIENNEGRYRVVYECFNKMQQFFTVTLADKTRLLQLVNDYLARLEHALRMKKEHETREGKSPETISYDLDLFGSQKRQMVIKVEITSAFTLLRSVYVHAASGQNLPPEFVERFYEICKTDPLHNDITQKLNRELGENFKSAIWEFHEHINQEGACVLNAELSNKRVPLDAISCYKKLFQKKGFINVDFVQEGQGYKIIIPDIQRQLLGILIQNFPSDIRDATHNLSP